MISALLSVVGAIITAAIVNKLLHDWQQRAWFAQQRHMGKSRELDDIQKLFEELNERANARLSANRFFLRNIGGEDEKATEHRLEEYRTEVFIWMSKLSGFYARLTLLLNYDLTVSLEQNIHSRLRLAGMKTEALYKLSKEGRRVSNEQKIDIEEILNSCQGAVNDLSRDILRVMIEKRAEIVSGVKIPYSRSNLDNFTTLELFKSLFIARVDTHYVIRPS